MRTVTIENSSEVKINLTNETRNCTVNTICSRSVFVLAPKEGNDGTSKNPEEWCKNGVSEIYESRMKGDALVTTVVEMIE